MSTDLAQDYARYRDAQDKLRRTAARVAEQLQTGACIYTSIQITDEAERSFNQILIPGGWVTVCPGTEVMLIDNTPMCSKPFCKNAADCSGIGPGSMCAELSATRGLGRGDGRGLFEHKHPCSEHIQVLQGYVESAGRTYLPGENLFFEAGEMHAVKINGLVMLCWRPCLEKIT